MDDANTLELIDGVIEDKDVGAESSSIGLTVGSLLKAAARDEGHDVVVVGSDCGYTCFPPKPNGKQTVRKPDVSLVLRHRLKDKCAPIGWIPVPADLAIEVVSPNDVASKLMQKVKLYLTNGFDLVWVLYPEQQHVVVYTPDSIRGFLPGDTLDVGPALPGVRVKVDDLFDD